MAPTSPRADRPRLESLAQEAAPRRGPAPVHLWNPPYCGEIGMRIRADGVWEYGGTPIEREAMVRLFASILKLEDEGYRLVTPVEKVGIEVEEVPFLAVALAVTGTGQDQVLRFTTNVGDEVEAGEGHAITVAEDPRTGHPRPYVHVRRGLLARLTRPVYYELAALAGPGRADGIEGLGVVSAGVFFPLDRITGALPLAKPP